MTTFPKFAVFVLAPCVALAGCSKKADNGEPVVMLTNSLQVTTGTGAPASPTEVVIAGVSQEETVSLIDMLHVSGLLTRGTQQVAIINGNVVSMGEDMDLTANGENYKLRVLSINDASIRLVAKKVDGF